MEKYIYIYELQIQRIIKNGEKVSRVGSSLTKEPVKLYISNGDVDKCDE